MSLYWKQRLKLCLKQTEDVGGIEMWVRRDNVAGTTLYQHSKDPFHLGIRGIFPHFRVSDNEQSEMNLGVGVYGGDIKKNKFQSRVMLNAQGTTATWDKGIESHECGGKFRTWVTLSANAEWLEALRAVPTAKLAVVRFTKQTPSHMSHFDFKLEAWNCRLVGDVLIAYDHLAQQLAGPKPSADPDPASLPGSSNAAFIGPFELMADGSITEPDTGLRLPPGIDVGKLVIEGYSLESHPSEGYVITDRAGERRRAAYRDGRWVVGKPRA